MTPFSAEARRPARLTGEPSAVGRVKSGAASPIAIVRTTAAGEATGRTDGEPERIVVGVDGSEPSRAALRWALREGAKRDAVVQAVHVWEVPVIYGPVGVGFPYDTGPIEDASRKLLDDVVDKAVAETGETGVTVERTLLSGGVATTVLEVADGADLLVVGRRGLGGFQRLLLGSVSEHLARHAPCPVVVIPAEEP